METITLRVPDELRTLIAEGAQANGQSQSDYMRQAIEIYVKRVDPPASDSSSCPRASS
ncbi:DUF6290 family protein [Corynebacterium diphtheriae]|uniref:DUF6290 family protein n=1 Tax=Corynebacterium diphtheriae TaxID=1717 RepID=UPI0013C93070|nr:DUF6290 family protein [Corynebacterium diphtheriae]MDZ5309898.1 DUF6290 family protein [Corynebacterium diphtheriae]CAB0527050.1 hypothetical protein CIP101841_02128 [Corynebacterium diphtheriae]CAB1027440.1 hypothetical protein FRC0547_00036 [Corynebacterium diphtheriae]